MAMMAFFIFFILCMRDTLARVLKVSLPPLALISSAIRMICAFSSSFSFRSFSRILAASRGCPYELGLAPRSSRALTSSKRRCSTARWRGFTRDRHLAACFSQMPQKYAGMSGRYTQALLMLAQQRRMSHAMRCTSASRVAPTRGDMTLGASRLVMLTRGRLRSSRSTMWDMAALLRSLASMYMAYEIGGRPQPSVSFSRPRLWPSSTRTQLTRPRRTAYTRALVSLSSGLSGMSGRPNQAVFLRVPRGFLPGAAGRLLRATSTAFLPFLA
mmetsp:Transcript_14004/g.30289  ORF Transcript_14004/g.30289 Transcript_14004/m.30289 type:complete len:271 (-) Transcript_14004:435-1247(-)